MSNIRLKNIVYHRKIVRREWNHKFRTNNTSKKSYFVCILLFNYMLSWLDISAFIEIYCFQVIFYHDENKRPAQPNQSKIAHDNR